MQSLKTDEVFQSYADVVDELRRQMPDADLQGKPFEITSDHEREIVQLKIDGTPYVLTRQQALDLSYALSRAAKRIVKKQRKSRG